MTSIIRHTKRAATGRMTLNELRQFLAAIEDVTGEATIGATVTWGGKLKAVTVKAETDDENVTARG